MDAQVSLSLRVTVVDRAAQGVRWNRMLGGPAHGTPCTAATTSAHGRCFEAPSVAPRRAPTAGRGAVSHGTFWPVRAG